LEELLIPAGILLTTYISSEYNGTVMNGTGIVPDTPDVGIIICDYPELQAICKLNRELPAVYRIPAEILYKCHPTGIVGCPSRNRGEVPSLLRVEAVDRYGSWRTCPPESSMRPIL
jgi:hypothetical protein